MQEETDGLLKDMEYEYEYGPAWRFVGRQLHFTEELEEIAARYVNRAFGLPVNVPTPRVRLPPRVACLGKPQLTKLWL